MNFTPRPERRARGGTFFPGRSYSPAFFPLWHDFGFFPGHGKSDASSDEASSI